MIRMDIEVVVKLAYDFIDKKYGNHKNTMIRIHKNEIFETRYFWIIPFGLPPSQEKKTDEHKDRIPIYSVGAFAVKVSKDNDEVSYLSFGDYSDLKKDKI